MSLGMMPQKGKQKIGHIVTRPGKRPGDPPITIPVAEILETVPGIPTRDEDVTFYSREYPLDTLNVDERASRDWGNRLRDMNPEMREIRREHDRLNRPIIEAGRLQGGMEPTAEPVPGKDVTEDIRAKARELGFLEVGFTKYDTRYTYARMRDRIEYEHAIALAWEQDYEATQTIPSIAAEIVHSGTYRTMGAAALELCEFIRSLGYHVQQHSPNDNTGAYLPMCVAAGIGQLGACGYLLTPHAGGRCRIMLLSTNAQVTYDQPVDYGIHAFCQICQVCVTRCPGRALMPGKVVWRGVEKNKLNFKRCRPVMARYLGCGICMKVCPIQKYGMQKVMEHFVDTGEVLGKGTDALEGYTLEATGATGSKTLGYFGPGQLPVFDASFFDMPHGKAEDWAFEVLVKKLKKAGSLQTDEGLKALEEFKTQLGVALSLSDDILKMELEDYIT
ncbi:MAG TPA: reductive dehalogenase domain-containing protein [Alphaproteobacteria bacterium]|nr:reductive dehalogenase domain-containing protein [Alphaproteobacteria bacterium]